MNPNSVIITSSLPLKKRRIEILDSKPYQHPKTITSSPLPQGYQSVETRDKILKRKKIIFLQSASLSTKMPLL